MVFQSELIPLQSWSIKLTEFVLTGDVKSVKKACESVKNLTQLISPLLTPLITLLPILERLPKIGVSHFNFKA